MPRKDKLQWPAAETTIRNIRRALLVWGRRNYRDFPWRHETSEFHALVAEVFLQRTRAEQVIPVYREFRKRFKSAKSLAKSHRSTLSRLTRSLGLNWRTPVLLRLARVISTKHRNKIPVDHQLLRELPGIGSYASAAFSSLHRGERAVIVDSNVVRLYGRLFGIRTHSESRRSKLLQEIGEALTPRKSADKFNYALLDFTREICRPIPKCLQCPILEHCNFGNKLNSQ